MLSVNGGYVDTAGFLALHGLFTTHVTGNFVTLGAALVLGTGGAVAKLLALPVFCIVVIATRLLSSMLAARNSGLGVPVLRALVGLKVALLILGAALAIGLGPFASGDGWAALLTGMTLVAAIMTGNTTQIMIDLADLMRGVPADARTRERLSRMSGSVAAFAAGCAAAALIYAKQDVWCFLLPPIVGACSLWLRELRQSA